MEDHTVVHISGMKNKPDLQDHIMPHIVSELEKIGITDFKETCAGGLGLNPIFHHKQRNLITWEINDTSESLVNLYTTIFKYPISLEIFCKAVIEHDFKNNIDVDVDTELKTTEIEQIKYHLMDEISDFWSKNLSMSTKLTL